MKGKTTGMDPNLIRGTKCQAAIKNQIEGGFATPIRDMDLDQNFGTLVVPGTDPK